MKLFYKPLTQKKKAALQALADGIECGAKLRPQAFNSLVKTVWDHEAERRAWGTCALGAAVECALVKEGVKDEEARLELVKECTDYTAILARYGLRDVQADKPIVIAETTLISRGEGEAFSTLIFRLNDTLHWSREQIAAFLRDLE